jgi:hypothetical protein
VSIHQASFAYMSDETAIFVWQLVTSWSQTLINLCVRLVGDHCLVSVEEHDRLKQNPEGGKVDQHTMPAFISESDFV